MRPRLAPSPKSAHENSTLALLHSTAAAIIAPMAGKENTPPLDDDDESSSDEAALVNDVLTDSDDDHFEDALEEEDEMSALRETPSEVDDGDQSDINISQTPRSHRQSDSVIQSSPSTARGTSSQAAPRVPPVRQTSAPHQGYFDRLTRHDTDSSTLSVPATPGATTPGGTKARKPIFRRNKSQTPSLSERQDKEKKRNGRKSRKDFNFDATYGKETLGVVIMEVKGATDLPRLKGGACIVFDLHPADFKH